MKKLQIGLLLLLAMTSSDLTLSPATAENNGVLNVRTISEPLYVNADSETKLRRNQEQLQALQLEAQKQDLTSEERLKQLVLLAMLKAERARLLSQTKNYEASLHIYEEAVDILTTIAPNTKQYDLLFQVAMDGALASRVYLNQDSKNMQRRIMTCYKYKRFFNIYQSVSEHITIDDHTQKGIGLLQDDYTNVCESL